MPLGKNIAYNLYMETLDYKELGLAIKNVYIDEGKYQLSKDVPTFTRDGKYVGDVFNFTMFELNGDEAPTFYHIFSPYDVITSKSCQHGVVLQAGEMLMMTEFTPYMIQRTGVMTSLVLQALGNTTISDKKVLYVGAGKIARADLTALKTHFRDLQEITFITGNSEGEEFIQLAKELELLATPGSLKDIENYDVIICHTNSKSPVLTKDMIDQIKDGAVITTFSSEDFTEVDSDFFNTDNANIVIDWEQTISESPELNLAVENGKAKKDEIKTLKQVLNEGIDANKKYTIYRSHGTPMQNLGAMQVLMKMEQ